MKLVFRLLLLLLIVLFFIACLRFFIDSWFQVNLQKVIHKKLIQKESMKYPAFVETRIALYINQENMIVQGKTRKKKHSKLSSNTNFRLSRLLYQLWDPNNYQNQANMLNCENLISLEDKKIRQGRKFAKKLNRKFYDYINVTDILETVKDSCLPFRNVFRYRTPNFGPASYPIAYTITLDRTAEQTLRMLAGIYHHDNVYCLHPNAKFGLSYINVFKRLAECVPNFILPEKIYSIRIKTFYRLKAEMGCFSKLLNVTVPWKYGINLPSSVFPLRNNSFMVQYLRQKNYESIVSWEGLNEKFLKRVRYSYILKEKEGDTLLLRTSIQKPPPPDDLILFRKGIHFISTRRFYEYITESSTANKLLNWLSDTKNPEDYFYSTLYRHKMAPDGLPYEPQTEEIQYKERRNTDESVSVIPQSDLLLTLWSSDRAQRCHGQYRGHLCTYGAADLRWLLEQDYLFAHSFDFRIDRVAVDCLTKHLVESILRDTI